MSRDVNDDRKMKFTDLPREVLHCLVCAPLQELTHLTVDTEHRGYSHLPPVTLHKQLTHLTVDTAVTATCLQSHFTNN